MDINLMYKCNLGNVTGKYFIIVTKLNVNCWIVCSFMDGHWEEWNKIIELLYDV